MMRRAGLQSPNLHPARPEQARPLLAPISSHPDRRAVFGSISCGGFTLANARHLSIPYTPTAPAPGSRIFASVSAASMRLFNDRQSVHPHRLNFLPRTVGPDDGYFVRPRSAAQTNNNR